MARVNVYLPDELAERVKSADINVSALTQQALEAEFRRRSMGDWWEQVRALPPLAGEVDSVQVVRAVRDDWEQHVADRTSRLSESDA
ncbi:MAG: type II toxin-antitoxin system CcdA family antitoxin [bacterium]